MLRVEITEVIDRPIKEVWSYISDPRKTPEYSRTPRERDVLFPGPVRKGTRFRNVDRILGRSIEYKGEVTEYDPPTRCAFRVVKGPFDGGWQEILERSQEELGSPASSREGSRGPSGSSRTPSLKGWSAERLGPPSENLKHLLESPARGEPAIADRGGPLR